jgi:hypothetical protein
VRKALKGKRPQIAAKGTIEGTRLDDVAVALADELTGIKAEGEDRKVIKSSVRVGSVRYLIYSNIATSR